MKIDGFNVWFNSHHSPPKEILWKGFATPWKSEKRVRDGEKLWAESHTRMHAPAQKRHCAVVVTLLWLFCEQPLVRT